MKVHLAGLPPYTVDEPEVPMAPSAPHVTPDSTPSAIEAAIAAANARAAAVAHQPEIIPNPTPSPSVVLTDPMAAVAEAAPAADSLLQ